MTHDSIGSRRSRPPGKTVVLAQLRNFRSFETLSAEPEQGKGDSLVARLGEGEQWRKISIVCCYESINVRFALHVGIAQKTAAPWQRVHVEMPNHGHMREHPRVPSVAVREGLDGDYSIVKANGDFGTAATRELHRKVGGGLF
jgi:hypothetical protein